MVVAGSVVTAQCSSPTDTAPLPFFLAGLPTTAADSTATAVGNTAAAVDLRAASVPEDTATAERLSTTASAELACEATPSAEICTSCAHEMVKPCIHGAATAESSEPNAQSAASTARMAASAAQVAATTAGKGVLQAQECLSAADRGDAESQHGPIVQSVISSVLLEDISAEGCHH